jgi:protein gp37
MPQKTSIEWTATVNADGTVSPGFTSNLIRYRDPSGKAVWACAKTSPGCAHCYAESIAHRYNRGGPFTLPVVETVTPYFAEKEAAAILKSKAISGKRVFVGDMTDVFGEWVADELLDRMFAVFALRPDVTFQVLTKRAERMRDYIAGCVKDGFLSLRRAGEPWPLPNVWLGVSTENQKYADERIPLLLQTPAAVRFVSYEPALEGVDFRLCPHPDDRLGCLRDPEEDSPVACIQCPTGRHWINGFDWTCYPRGAPSRNCGIDWIICGGESGPKRRPMDLAWARSARDQCQQASVAFFLKQCEVNGKVTGELDDMPEDLQVRDWPNVEAVHET